MLGSPNAGEREAAHKKLCELLAEYGLTWNDLPTLLAADIPDGPPSSAASSGAASSGAASQAAPPDRNAPQVNVLDLVLRLLELHIGLPPEQRMAVALWTLHTHIFANFTITPRLVLVSPVRGCGKTTLLILLEQLTADPYRSDNVTAAAVYHEIAGRERTLLFDEADNLGLLKNNVLRAVFNAGHRRGGAISRFVAGRSRKFPVFAPLVVAAIGLLPLPLMHRAAVINMQRRSVDEPPLQRLNEFDPTFPAAREEIRKWAATCSLAAEPEMPPKLCNRPADNWRVLLAIADDLGHGEEARAAAVALSSGRLDEDPGVILLTDIRDMFAALGTDRVPSATLVGRLHDIEDGLWHDWRGPNDDRPPHKLTQGELARLLRAFGIRSRTIWPANRGPGAKSCRGYLELPPANRCACCRRTHFDPPGSKTGGPISGGPFFSRAPSEPEAHKHAFKKRGYTPLATTLN
jgi:hypothetical protein